MDDSELLRRYAADRSEEAFAALVGRHLNFVYRTALRQANGDVHRARDVAQLVFTLLARKAGALTHHPALTGWLHTSTHFIASDLLRSEHRRQLREQRAQTMHELSSESVPADDWGRMRPVLDDAMRELNRVDREAILLRFFEGLPFADVGAKLSLREDTARIRVSRALERLRASLARRGVASSTAAMTALLASEAGAMAPEDLAATVTGRALASASGAGAPAGSFSRSLAAAKPFLVAGVLVLATGGVALREWEEAWHARALSAQAGRSLAARQDGLRAVRQRAQAAEQRLDAARRPEAGAPAGEAAGSGGGWSRGRVIDREKFLAAYPEARRLLAEVIGLRTARDYGAFYKSAELTTAQIGRFENLMAETLLENTTLATNGLSIPEGQPPEAPLRAIIGDPAYDQFQDYCQGGRARAFAARVAAAVSTTATPLNPEQMAALARLVARHGVSVGDDGSLDPPATDWEAAGAAAAGVMTPAQWKSAESVFLGLQLSQAYAAAQKAR